MSEKVEEKKICHQCFEEKLISEFRAFKLRGGGISYRNKCLDCNRAAFRRYNELHREIVNARAQAWRVNNPEKVTAYERKHYKENCVKYKERSKEWIKNNQERHREFSRNYYRKKVLNSK